MRGWAARLATLGDVVTFDYPYMKAGRKAPDKLPALIAAHRQAVVEAQAAHGVDRPLVLAGKSMGSRVGCHLAVELQDEQRPPAALVCFGYPLRGTSGALRDEVLRALTTPILFLQGSRDSLGPLDELERVRGQLRARSELFVVEGGDHSLAVRRRPGAGNQGGQERVDRDLLGAIDRFLRAQGALEGPA
jgi:predicted alpha/beta-hydrolase family hydrolase